MHATWRHRVGVALAAAVLAAGAGCGWPFRLHEARHEAREELIPLLVRNHGSFDVSVIVVRTGGGHGRRLATVSGYAGVELAVRPGELQRGGALVLCLHAIGSRYAWVTPAVVVRRGMSAYLDVYTDRDGNLSRSTLRSGPVIVTTHTAPRSSEAVWVARLTSRPR